jgi:AcrR family transcriptional regulator
MEQNRVRVRTEDRRQAIIDIATEVFREVGYERASMAMISRRLGGSKGTLYGYFRSKEDLFETAMKAASEGPGDQIMNLLDPTTDDLPSVLINFARAYLAFICGSDVLSITRTAIAEGSSSSLGPHLFEQGPGRALDKMSTFFEAMIARKRVCNTSARIAALHFKGLIEAGFLEQALYGAPTEQNEATSDAVATFLRAFGS